MSDFEALAGEVVCYFGTAWAGGAGRVSTFEDIVGLLDYKLPA